MKKTELSPIELKEVVQLRQSGANWTEIQHQTKRDRRVVRRAYEEWESDKKKREQEAARFRVAAEAFHEHLNDLVAVATGFVWNLEVREFSENSEQFFSSFFDQDLLGRKVFATSEMDMDASGPEDALSYRLEKELLFESLKVHTRDKVPWEDLLDNRWKKARDKCAEIVPQLRREASEVVNNLLNQEPNLLQSIKEGSGESDPAKKMAETLLRVISKRILEDKLNQEGPWFETVSRADGKTHVVYVKPRDEIVLGFTDKSLAEKVTRICELVANNLREGNMVQQLHDEVPNMRKAAEELREMLNPVKLKPMILRTRCDLCPA